MKKIAIIGGRGNGTVIASAIIDCIKAGQDLKLVGFINDDPSPIWNFNIISPVSSQSILSLPNDIFFVYALSNVKMAKERHLLLQKLSLPIQRYANIKHPSSIISEYARLGYGNSFMPYSVISPDVKIENHCSFLAQSFVGHDTHVSDMVFVANNASLGGRVEVKEGAHIGSNSSIRERLKIGKYSIVGIGSTVIKDVRDNAIVAGNPAKIIGDDK